MPALADIFSTPLVSGSRRGDAPLDATPYRRPVPYVQDASGHEHKGPGSPEGGQFTGNGGGGGEQTSQPVRTKMVTKNLLRQAAAKTGLDENWLSQLVEERARNARIPKGLAFDIVVSERSPQSQVQPIPQPVVPTATVSKQPQPQKTSKAPPTVESLRSSPIKKAKNLAGGVNKVSLLTLEDGSTAVFKPANGETPDTRETVPNGTLYRREAAAYDVARALGIDLVPTTTIRESEDGPGSIQQYVPDAMNGLEARASGIRGYDRGHISLFGELMGDSEQDVANAAAFDYIIGNLDRNEGNWLIKKTSKPDGTFFNKLTLIDNGLSFPVPDEFVDNRGGDFAWKFIEDEAIGRQLTVPTISPQAWQRIESALIGHRIEPQAIEATKKRFDNLVAMSGQPFTKARMI